MNPITLFKEYFPRGNQQIETLILDGLTLGDFAAWQVELLDREVLPEGLEAEVEDAERLFAYFARRFGPACSADGSWRCPFQAVQWLGRLREDVDEGSREPFVNFFVQAEREA